MPIYSFGPRLPVNALVYRLESQPLSLDTPNQSVSSPVVVVVVVVFRPCGRGRGRGGVGRTTTRGLATLNVSFLPIQLIYTLVLFYPPIHGNAIAVAIESSSAQEALGLVLPSWALRNITQALRNIALTWGMTVFLSACFLSFSLSLSLSRLPFPLPLTSRKAHYQISPSPRAAAA